MATLGSIGWPRATRARKGAVFPPSGVSPRNQPRAQGTSSLPASLSILPAGVKASMRRPPSVNKNLSRVLLGDRARGLALLRGEPQFLRRGGNPPAPAFP